MKISKLSVTSLFFFLILLAAALKDDLEAITSSEYWSELSIHPAISFLKSSSYVLLIMAGIIGFFIIIRTKHLSIRISSASTILLALTLVSGMRATYFDMNAAFKLFQAFALTLFIILVGGRLTSDCGITQIKQKLANAFFIFSATFIVINAMNVAFGYGFAPNNPRFFGTATHPNFIGSQLAICNIIVAARIISSNFARFRQYIASIILLSGGIPALLLTGSRTAFLMFIVGTSVLWLSKRKFKVDIWLLAALLTFFSLLMFVIFQADIDSAFYRGEGGTNTRSDVWISMINLIIDNPWFGYGYFIENSENSYLRSMIAFGIPFGIALSSVVLLCTVKLFKLSWNNRKFPDKPEHLFFALMLALLMGGIFEGFLIDSWSLPKLTFILLTVATITSSNHQHQHLNQK